MKPKFTPGPWHVFDPVEYGTLEVQNEECDPVASGIEDGSDAAIIAAAPEMYEALEMVMKAWEDLEKPDYDEIDRVLKKARGEK